MVGIETVDEAARDKTRTISSLSKGWRHSGSNLNRGYAQPVRWSKGKMKTRSEKRK